MSADEVSWAANLSGYDVEERCAGNCSKLTTIFAGDSKRVIGNELLCAAEDK
jgi:hypothetical protein